MHNAIGNDFGAIVVPVHRVRGGVERVRSKLLQSENGHAGSRWLGPRLGAIDHRSHEVNEPFMNGRANWRLISAG
jgi:hypothetical protein